MLLAALYFPYDLFILLALALLAVYIPGKDKIRISVRCKLCGMVICRRCQRTATDDLVCTHCQSLLRKQSMLGYGVREDKRNRIKSYITRKRITVVALGYILPGAGHFYAGQTLIGIAGMLVFFMLVLKTVMPFVLEGPWSFLLGSRIGTGAAYGSLLFVYWFFMTVSCTTNSGQINRRKSAFKNYCLAGHYDSTAGFYKRFRCC